MNAPGQPQRLRWYQFSLRGLLLLTAIVAAVCACCFRPVGGPLPVKTGRDLDVAIFGQGFFQIRDPNSGVIYYTRCGSLRLDVDGHLATGRGPVPLLLEPPIIVPQDWTSIIIARDGMVSYSVSYAAQSNQIAQIQLARFSNPEGLREVMPGTFQETDDCGTPMIGAPGTSGLGLLVQQWLESSDPAWKVRMADLLPWAMLLALVWIAIELRRQRRILEDLARHPRVI